MKDKYYSYILQKDFILIGLAKKLTITEVPDVMSVEMFVK